MKKKKRRPIRLPVPEYSDKVLVSVPPQHVGMFRFLLEGYDNIASFTVLDRAEALLKVFFSPHQLRRRVPLLRALPRYCR